MSNLIPVKGEKDLFRDPETNAIINVSDKEYEMYINSKMRRQMESFRMDKVENDLNSLKSDIDEIKILLRNFLNGSK